MKHDTLDWPRSAYEVRAHVYEAMGKYEDAINDLTKAFEVWEKVFGKFIKENGLGSLILRYTGPSRSGSQKAQTIPKRH